jgi:hypothetical protein
MAAAAVRMAAAPGADLDTVAREMLGRAPRLDGYWYTRKAVDQARGSDPGDVPVTFDRPLHTLYCRAVFALTGTGEGAIAAPAIAAAALACAALVLVGRASGLGAAAWLAGVFAATNWIAVLHDREPLVYSSVNLAFLLAFLAWARGMHRPLWFAVAWLGVAAVAAGGKETVLLAVPALVVGHLLHGRRSPAAKAAAAAAALAALVAAAALAWLLAPALVASFAHKVAARFALAEVPFPAGWVIALGDLPATLAVVGRIPAVAALAAVGIVAIVIEGKRDEPDPERVLRQVLALWLVVGCVVVAGFSYRPTRYVLGLFAPAFLLAAHGARVLWSGAAAGARLRPWPRTLALGAVWWLTYASLYAWLADALPVAVRDALPALMWSPSVRLGIAAALAVFTELQRGAAIAASGRIPQSRRWAVALAVFVLVTDARGFFSHCRPVTRWDVAARRSFESCVGPGARVQGYAAHYLAFAPTYRVLFAFAVRPAALKENAGGGTHLATLWIPELAYVERQMAAAGAPLLRVADVVVGSERYRVYRLSGAEARGYVLTPFERARLLEENGDVAAAAALYRELAADAADPTVLAYAGAGIARVAAGDGLALLARASAEAPRNGVILSLAAEAAARAGAGDLSGSLLARAGPLLPHELVVGFGARPQRTVP